MTDPISPSSNITIQRRWKWKFFVLLFAVIVFSPFAAMGFIVPFHYIVSAQEKTVTLTLFTVLLLFFPLSWLLFCREIWRLVSCRSQPLIIAKPDTICFPHSKPGSLRWHDILAVEQEVYVGKKYLRLRLREPKKHLSRLQIIGNSPYRDSMLVVLDPADSSPSQHPDYLAIKDYHRQAIAR